MGGGGKDPTTKAPNTPSPSPNHHLNTPFCFRLIIAHASETVFSASVDNGVNVITSSEKDNAFRRANRRGQSKSTGL